MTPERIEQLLGDPLADPQQLACAIGISTKINRRIAAHGNASAELLTMLAKSPDRLTRRGVAMNAQTPKDVLLTLAPTFAGEFFLNPAFDLLLFEDPSLLSALPVGVMKNILKRPDCPSSFLRWAVRYGSKSHQLAVVARPDATREMLETIAAGPHGPPAEIAAGRLLGGDVIDTD